VGSIGLFYIIDQKQLRSYLNEQILVATGYEVVLKQDLKVKLWPIPSITTQEVHFSWKDPASNTQYNATAETVSLKTGFRALMSNTLQINQITLKNLVVAVIPVNAPAQEYQLPHLSGQITREGGLTSINHISLETAATKVEGDLQLTKSNKKPQIEGTLNFEKFEYHSPKLALSKPAPNLISTKIWDTAWLGKYLINTKIKFKHIIFDELALNDVQLQLQLKDSQLQIKDFKAELAQGILEGHLKYQLEKIAFHNSAVLNLRLRDANFAKLVENITDDANWSKGQFNFEFKGQGKGDSLKTILGTLDGSLFYDLTNAQLDNQVFTTNASEIFTNFLGFLNPFAKKTNDTKIICGVGLLEAKAGKVYSAKNISFETPEFNLIGTAKVDLTTEAIEFEFNTEKNANVNLALVDFDNYFKVKGTLAKPIVVPNSTGILSSGFSLYSAITSGGLSLIANQVVSTITKDRTPCERIRKVALEQEVIESLE
jgi:uncharacterized protein involved in outer membrane biogenesis